MSDNPAIEEILPSLAELVAPVAGGSPVGEDPKYSVEFEFVKAEIAKTTERDWEKIHEAAHKVLTAQAKDITLFCYGMLAATMAKGWSEGAAMARAMADLCKEHWDAIHPQRERARQNSVKWLTEERTLGTFAQKTPSSSDYEALAAFAAALNDIKNILNEKYSDNPPSIKPLIQFVEEKAKENKPAAAAPPPPPPPPPGASQTESDSGASQIAAPAIGDGASKTDLMNALRKIALSVAAAEPDNPMGYKLLRISRWQEVSVAPKNDKGVSVFNPPNPQRAAFLDSQFQQKSWATILEKSEPAFTEPGFHFWFDLQFWAVQALQGKGLEACAEAIRQELRGLLKRVPQLAEMKFSDGSPFANGQTRAWMEEILQQGSGGGSRQSAAAREDTLDADLSAAKELASSGSVADAIDILQAGLIYGDRRSRTIRQLEIARLALQHGKIRAALAVSTEIAERSECMSLSAWEPQLARSISEIHIKALTAAIEGNIGDVTALTQKREIVALKAGSEDPALISRFDF
ncbi:MAG TPA: type VI secretion system protein TssA [Fibrobacteria bacterium]|nr:type VI secretion system protein TssA [Fibrobacteria bacterium]